jgi:preprotein translocase subunit SecE
MDFRVLGVTVLVFVVLGTVLCWGMEKLIRWFKQRR